MSDSYDFATAIKDVAREMPEAAEQIRKYIGYLKSQIVEKVDETAEMVSN